MKPRHLFSTLLAWWCVTLLAAAQTPPRISPDYAGITLPPNIAPLNFRIEESGQRFQVRIHGAQGQPIELTSAAVVIIPIKPWRALLEANRGGVLLVDIAGSAPGGGWTALGTITNRIAREPVDGYLTYRLLRPLYNLFTHMGIYQRNLADYSEKVVLDNQSFGQGCVNCHCLLNQRTSPMLLQIRHRGAGNPMLLAQSNQVTQVSRAFGYSAWHPSGRLIAYSANKLSLFYHTTGETRDVYDEESNLGVYWVDRNQLEIPPVISRRDRQETWPAWSPDGKWLYFCSAPVLPLDRAREIRYDLQRVSFDLNTGTWGEVETLLSAADSGLSAAQPKPSPDGRFLMFCLCHHGHFPIYQPSSDLYLINLATRQIQRLETINSPEADTWHCWSSNSRWVVFSSKRSDGVFARPYFTYCDAEGQFSKPFVMPQQNPEFYGSFLRTYNVPELTIEPITVASEQFVEAIQTPRRAIKPQPDPRLGGGQTMSVEVDSITSGAKAPSGTNFHKP